MLEVLKKQETAELAAASAQVAAAQAAFEHNQTIDNQVALTAALANADGVRAKVAGLMSEQQMNAMALTREYNELLKAQAQSTTELNIANAKFAADSIKNDLERLNAQRGVLEQEKVIQLERLQSEIDKYNQGTQARLDAEIAYNTKKQELDQALATNATAISDAEIARTNELNVLRAQNDLIGFDERRALLELEYAEKERLAFGDAEKIVELEREKQEKIRQLNLETFQANLDLAQQGVSALQGLADVAFANKMSKVKKGSKEEEELARKQFNFNKKLQLAGAIIDAGKAITASLAAAPVAIGVVPNPAGIASLAFAALTSAANIAKIASTKYESSTPPSTTTPPSIGGGGEGGGTSAPTFNALNFDQLNNRPQQPIPAYVLAGDVASGIEARDKVIDLARIG